MDNDWWQKFEDLERNFFANNHELNEKDLEKLISKIREFKEAIEKYQENILRLGRIVDYNELRKKGISLDKIIQFYEDDKIIAEKAKRHLKEQVSQERNYMFGYPANMTNESSLISYLRWIESQLFYINSCGTPYSSGNYRMVQRDTEKEIISKVLDNLNLKNDEYWGYITTGGTEGNLWGIREGFSKYPNGKLYFSKDTHYSALKGATILPNDNYTVISSIKGSIDKEELLKKILADSNSSVNGVILLLNYGTTALGSIDDIAWIMNKIAENNIPCYVHIDAALYGGIPRNQVNSPANYLNEITSMGIDSISISLHKYLGIPKTNGVLLAKSKINSKFIDYIGQFDVTLCGSRDFLPYTTLQKIKEQYERNNDDDYSNNVIFFENLLNENNIFYEKGLETGNIFILDKPSDDICKKYQLAAFNYNGQEKIHVIIFPFHHLEIIRELVNDLKNELGYSKRYKIGDKK